MTACFRRPFPGCWHTPRSGSGGDGAVAPAAEGHTQRPEGWKKDETDRELDTILQQIYSDQCGSDSIEERTGPPSAFFAAAVKVLPRAKDDRTRAKRWRDAHDRGYLVRANRSYDYHGPVIVFSGQEPSPAGAP